jgi:hypothetical protein
MLMPVILCFLVGALGYTINFFKGNRLKIGEQVNRLIQCIVFIMILSFTMIVVTLVQPFNCFRRDDGKYYLYADQSKLCYDTEWKQNVSASSFYFILYLAAIPGSCIAALYTYRHKLDEPLFKKRFGQLVAPYKKKYFWWEIVVISRKIVLGLTFQVFGSFLSKTGQVFFIILMLFGFLFLEVVNMPSATLHDNVLSIM